MWDAIFSFLEVLWPFVRQEQGYGWRVSREKATALIKAVLGVLVTVGVISTDQVNPETLVGIWVALQALGESAKRDRQQHKS